MTCSVRQFGGGPNLLFSQGLLSSSQLPVAIKSSYWFVTLVLQGKFAMLITLGRQDQYSMAPMQAVSLVMSANIYKRSTTNPLHQLLGAIPRVEVLRQNVAKHNVYVT